MLRILAQLSEMTVNKLDRLILEDLRIRRILTAYRDWETNKRYRAQKRSYKVRPVQRIFGKQFTCLGGEQKGQIFER